MCKLIKLEIRKLGYVQINVKILLWKDKIDEPFVNQIKREKRKSQIR